jgi:hypothetical protein
MLEGNLTSSTVPEVLKVQTMLKGTATSGGQQIPLISTTEPSSLARAKPL